MHHVAELERPAQESCLFLTGDSGCTASVLNFFVTPPPPLPCFAFLYSLLRISLTSFTRPVNMGYTVHMADYLTAAFPPGPSSQASTKEVLSNQPLPAPSWSVAVGLRGAIHLSSEEGGKDACGEPLAERHEAVTRPTRQVLRRSGQLSVKR